ncbi:MAG: TonB-dependent receptor, partial [Bacteroidales bacterium]|nr:TonB-dependent receptor [Bacteroidales bacterium]
EHYVTENSNQAMAWREMTTTAIRDANPFLYEDPDYPFELPATVLPYGGFLERTTNELNGWDVRLSANYSNVFASDHIVNLFGGMEVNSIDRHGTDFTGAGMQFDMGEVAAFDYRYFKKLQEGGNQYFFLSNRHDRSAAFFGNATYSYQGKYTLNGTVRYEGTNRLGKSRTARWLPTWNVSGSWNIHEEEWMKGLYPTLSHLSLKASYSLTGDRGPSSVTNSMVVIQAETPYRPFTAVQETGLAIADLANYELTYEKKHELNIGLEAGFFDNRINIVADWYTRENFDLIGPVNTQGIGGGGITKLGNSASMHSDGVELSLSSTNIKTRDFSWSTSIIYSHSNNVVTKLENVSRILPMVSGSGFAMQGYPVRSLFSIPFTGLNEEGLPTFINQDGNPTVSDFDFQASEPEKLKFLEYSGNVDPTDVGSLGNIFTWKGFKLNVFITYSFGNVVRLDRVFRSSYSDLDSMPREFANRWVVPGDEYKTNVPVIASYWQNVSYAQNSEYLSRAYNAYNYSSARVAKGDFIRLKEVSLAYDFPQSISKKLGVNALGLKLQATNLFLLYADKRLNGQDPEFFNTGGVALPLAKQFTMTLKIGF